jgi:hypothetical protein
MAVAVGSPTVIRSFTQTCLLTCLALSGATGMAWAQAGRPIQFSEPRSERVNTNLNRLGQGLSGLDRLESDLNKPFQFMTPGDSMKGRFLNAPLPVPPPVVNSSRVKELIDRKRDYPFMTSEELFQVQDPAERFKAPELTSDGRDRKSLRPMERALLDEANATSVTIPSPTDRLNRMPGNPYSQMGQTMPGTANGNLGNLDRELKNLLGFESNSGSDNAAKRPAEDFFSYGESSLPTASRRTPSQIQRIEEFKKLYDFNNTLPGGTTPADVSKYANPYVDRSFYDLSAKPAMPAANAGFTSRTITETAPAYTPPAVTPPPVYTPPPSAFPSVPKMNF